MFWFVFSIVGCNLFNFFSSGSRVLDCSSILYVGLRMMYRLCLMICVSRLISFGFL